MPHDPFRARLSSLSRTLVPALVATLIPIGSAFAQSVSVPVPIPFVRIAADNLGVTSKVHGEGEVLMRVTEGDVLEVLYTEGDRYTHRESNWYWVLLPRDPWGTRFPGWVSGRDVRGVDAAELVKPAASRDRIADAPAMAPMTTGTADRAALEMDAWRPEAPAPAFAPAAPVSGPAVSEVVLNFEFGESELTATATGKLAEAVAILKTSAGGVSFALEGHADWIGSAAFNEKLGLARAETVKKYLAEQHQIPADKISVVSYGENQPAASNDSSEGRAQNRRVVVKVGA